MRARPGRELRRTRNAHQASNQILDPLPQISLDLSTSFAESLTPLGLEEPLRKLNNFLNNKNWI